MRWIIFVVMGCLLMGQGTRVQAQSYMPVDTVQRGMKGIGRTVFQGTQIDTFQVEILGVLRNVFGPKSDMILARLSGGPLAETGVIAGMSGSPVYIDGKLIGAVGYSLGAFSKEPIAGITPIGEMMGVLNRTQTDTLAQGRGQIGHWNGLADLTSHSAKTMVPVAVPLMFSGFLPEVMADYRNDLMQYGLLPMQGGGGTDASLPTGMFEPGAPLGVQLIRGDMSVTGIGTLTHRVGDRVVGFGHPMLFGGNTKLPMTAAYIHQVVASQMQSFKLGAASETMGAILQDRAPGIAGVVGTQADMMPVRIEVTSSGQAETFRMEVLHDRELGPILVRMAVASSLISAEKLSGETTVHGGVTIGLHGRSPLVINDVFAGPQGLGGAVLGLTQPLVQLMQNPFEVAQIDSVVFRFQVQEQTHSAQIEGIRLSSVRMDPGDTLHLAVMLTPVLGTPETVSLDLVLPKYAPKGRAMLRVMSEGQALTQESKRIPGVYDAENLDDLVRVLAQPGRNDVLVVDVLGSQKSLTVGGREVSQLPESVVAALGLSRESGVVQQSRQAVLCRVRVATSYVLTGNQTVLISIGEDNEGLMFTGKGGSGEQKQ